MYQKRRQKLVEMVCEKYSSATKGVVVLFASFENARQPFLQESSFYYLTGICEPGAVLCLYLDGTEELFLPLFEKKRTRWVTKTVIPDFETKPLGKPCTGYCMKPFFYEEEYEHLSRRLQEYLGCDGMLYTLLDQSNDSYFLPIHRFEKLFLCLDIVAQQVADISSLVARLRRKKDEHELALIQQAVDVTCNAHRAVQEIIQPGMYEYEVQAEIERVFTSNQAAIAFPSIVATGKNTTILHYMDRDQELKKNDLLVVDIGAQVGHYCADLTRTYAVRGSWTLRQQEVYEIVRDVQAYIASNAKPGLFLINPLLPERSLHHMAESFLKKIGYDQYFVHGIGHFLGLDVHDVGDMVVPMDVGDVFTIEPGIYIAQEDIGVRIEDDYVITTSGCRCLSDELEK